MVPNSRQYAKKKKLNLLTLTRLLPRKNKFTTMKKKKNQVKKVKSMNDNGDLIFKNSKPIKDAFIVPFNGKCGYLFVLSINTQCHNFFFFFFIMAFSARAVS